MCWVYFLTLKSEDFEYFRKFKALAEKQSDHKIKTPRIDREGDICFNEFIEFCESEGIKRELTAPYNPEQNGIVEQTNRTVVEMAHSMIKSKKLSDDFWAEAVATAVYLLNLSPTNSAQAESKIQAIYIWKEAMVNEIAAINKNETWELTDFPEMARFEMIRIILALAAQHCWKVFQFDVKLSFLNGDLKEEVYVQQPEGFEVQRDDYKVYNLKKALYGLKQAPRAWYNKVDEFFRINGSSGGRHTLFL
ncbi:retrovirus-related pol polyprotein from transposon TNT 1-94 [Tanacetum coccineum]